VLRKAASEKDQSLQTGQGLKPALMCAGCGTTEVVPCYKTLVKSSFPQVDEVRHTRHSDDCVVLITEH